MSAAAPTAAQDHVGQPGKSSKFGSPSRMPTHGLDRWNREGEQALTKGDLAAAEKAFATGLHKAQSLGAKPWMATFLTGLGKVYGARQQWDRGRAVLERALALRQQLGDESDIAASFGNLGAIYLGHGKLDAALDYHQRALALYQKRGEQPGVAQALNGLGLDYLTQGEIDRAVDCFQRELAIGEKLGGDTEIVHSLMGLCKASVDSGRFEEGRGYAERILKIAEKHDDRQTVSLWLNNLGVFSRNLNQFDQALDYHERALTLQEKLGNRYVIGRSLGNLGMIYSFLGQSETALDYNRRAETLFEQSQDLSGMAANLSMRSTIELDRGEIGKALDDAKRALRIEEQQHDRPSIAIGMMLLGGIYRNLGQFDRALDCLDRARAIQAQLGNEEGVALCMGNQASVYEKKGQLDRALALDKRALAIFEQRKDRYNIMAALMGLESIYAHQGRTADALAVGERAIGYYEEFSGQVGDPEQVGAFEEEQGSPYAFCAGLLMRRKSPDAPGALVMVERGKAEGLARQVAQNHAELAGLLPAADAARLKTATEAWVAADNLLNRVNVRPLPTDRKVRETLRKQAEEARGRLDQAARRLMLVRADLYQRYPEYRRLQGADPPDFARLQALAAQHSDTLYLEWAVVDEKTTLLFALSQTDGFHAFSLPVGATRLAALTQSWRQAITAPGETRPELRAAALKSAATEPAQAQALYWLLFAPLEKTGMLAPGRYARLALVPDGPLLDLPFVALCDATGQRLVQRFALATSLGLGPLTWPAQAASPSATLLCAADPAGKQGQRLHSRARGGFSALPFARQEAKAVVDLFAGGVALLGSEAQKGRVTQEIGRYALLHFATHAVLDSRQGLRSALVLAPEPDGSPEAGFLEAREILRLPLAARLVVLSACETGLGQKSGGEGLVGLAWAFRAAGCPSIVASQWKVDDAATRDLMVAFYQALKAGRSKDEALQRAMRSVQRTHPLPYYWAAFQVIGDTAPIDDLLHGS